MPRLDDDGRTRILTTALATPPIASIVPDGVFDAFGWCASDTLEWRRAEGQWSSETTVTGANPPGMIFVLRAECDFLPRELARVHAFGLGLEEEQALAPYAIDDATDELYARRARPRDHLWLAANNLAALAWGLHDWAHFHSHGPFTARAWTELQCDASALAWLLCNRQQIPLEDARWEEMRRAFARLSAERFRDEKLAFDEAWLSAARMHELAGSP
jgi:hypothetical protein